LLGSSTHPDQFVNCDAGFDGRVAADAVREGPEETIARHVVGDGPIDLVITIRKPSRSKGQARAIAPGAETELRRRE
jgi:hypothetical protein